jgi:hypothetical protein
MNRARRQEIEEGKRDREKRNGTKKTRNGGRGRGYRRKGGGHMGAGQGRADLKQYVLSSVYCI